MNRDLAEVVGMADRYGLDLNARDAVTDGLPDGWAILPRHWGYKLYDYTVLPATCCGWSGGWRYGAKRRRQAIEDARESIVRHVRRCGCASLADVRPPCKVWWWQR